jgi:ABC-type phosphate transport system substrate-binding protein
MRSLPALVVLAAAVAAAPAAQAASNGPCATVIKNPIYVGGSTALGPLLKSIDVALATANSDNQLVFANATGQTGSCVGAGFILADTTPTGTCATGACPTGTGQYFDAAGNPQTCDLPTDAHLDIAISDVWPTSCAGVSTVPAEVATFDGPVQAMLFVTSKSNPTPQAAITAEEAYFVFGFGGAAGMASPWLNVALQIVRNHGSGTEQMTMRAIGIPGDYINADKIKGTDAGGSGGVVSMVGASSDPAVIGILGADQYDIHRDTLRAMAFKAFGQWFAYYPDSTPTAFDKINVRDGHYWIWGPEHFLYRVNGTTPVRGNAQLALDLLQGKQALTPSILDLEISSHVIPTCAMKVTRTTEVGPLKKYTDPAPCGCYFEQKAAGATSCTACTGADGTACSGGGVCRHKFCEAN